MVHGRPTARGFARQGVLDRNDQPPPAEHNQTGRSPITGLARHYMSLYVIIDHYTIWHGLAECLFGPSERSNHDSVIMMIALVSRHLGELGALILKSPIPDDIDILCRRKLQV
jgi:hypothetical protein